MNLTVTRTLAISILLIMMFSLAFSLSNGSNYGSMEGASSQNVTPLGTTSPVTDWNNSYSFSGSDIGALHPLAKTTDGGYILAGTTIHYSSYPPGSTYVVSETFCVCKIDSTGKQQWIENNYVGNVRARANSIIQTNDGGYAIVGYTASVVIYDYSTFSQGYITAGLADVNICLLKMDTNGDKQWVRYYNNSNTGPAGYSIVQNDDGGFTIVGSTYSSNVTDSAYLMRTDSTGNLQWSKTYLLSGGNSTGLDLVKSSDGGYAVSGFSESSVTGAYQYLLLKINSNGDEQWANVFGDADSYATSLVQTSDRGYALIGYTSSVGAGKNDVYLVKTDAEGNLQWGNTYGGSQDDKGYSVVQTSDGYAMAGQTASYGTNATNGWLVKTDLNGNMQWSETFAPYRDHAYGIVKLNDGSYVLGGDFENLLNGNFHALFLIKVESDGSINATPIPTASPTPSPTPTANPTPIPTTAPTQTPTPTSTTTATTTATPISTTSPTQSPTTTPTHIATQDPTSTSTPTKTPTTNPNPSTSIPEFSSWIVPFLIGLMLTVAGLLTFTKIRHRGLSKSNLIASEPD